MGTTEKRNAAHKRNLNIWVIKPTLVGFQYPLFDLYLKSLRMGEPAQGIVPCIYVPIEGFFFQPFDHE